MAPSAVAHSAVAAGMTARIRRAISTPLSAALIRAGVTEPSTPTDGTVETGARLGLALLAYMLGVTLIITLLPFQFDWPTRWRVMFTGGPVDIVANVLLFLPLGFLFRLARREGERHAALTVLWIGALVSMAIESAQLFERERYASVLDVATNGLGAWLGAIAYDRLASRRRVDGVLIGRLSLELPLMGLVYLMIPLLWLNALASGPVAERAVLSLLLGVFGASLLGGIQRHHFGPVRSLDARVTAAAAALWFVAGTFPALATHPTMLLTGTLLVGGLAWWQGSRAFTLLPSNRRFEVPLLTSAAPAYAAYLILLTLAPLLQGVDAWQIGVTFPGVATEWTKTEILRFLEQVAAFTLLGYMTAEFRGRSVPAYRLALPRLVLMSAAATLMGEGIRGFHEGHGASIARGCVLLAAAMYGGWLYYLQRSHVKELLSTRNPLPAARTSPWERVDAA
ncbi:MAG: VanZ family protein [Gemmatimonadetes bacterium]|nr:VanZ family protein [Gemmatimonadota bacterium]